MKINLVKFLSSALEKFYFFLFIKNFIRKYGECDAYLKILLKLIGINEYEIEELKKVVNDKNDKKRNLVSLIFKK